RQPSARALRADLLGYLESGRWPKYTVKLTTRLEESARRNPKKTSVAALILLAGILATAGWLTRGGNAAEERASKFAQEITALEDDSKRERCRSLIEAYEDAQRAQVMLHRSPDPVTEAQHRAEFARKKRRIDALAANVPSDPKQVVRLTLEKAG